MNNTDAILVMKFGGTSVGSVSAMRQAAQIVQDVYASRQQLVIVASALNGVTDQLLQSADLAAQGDKQTAHRVSDELRERHFEIAAALVPDLALQVQVKQEIDHLLDDFTNLCQAIAVLGEATPRARDTVASLGERLCVRVLSASIACKGVPAQYIDASQLIITDDHYQSAHPDMTATTEKVCCWLKPLLQQRRVPVVTGFIGGSKAGITTTLGRGGSDYSAAILAVSLRAADVWIWTDVDGVMTADPRLVPEARTIPELSFNEVAEMAYFGAKVLHPKTIHPILAAGINLRVCNTFAPEKSGTQVVTERKEIPRGRITAVTSIRGLNMITLEGRGMLGVPGVAARIFTAVATTGASIPLIAEASSEQSICFAIAADRSAAAIQALRSALAVELAQGDIDRIWPTGEVALIGIVCPGMRSTPGISARIFNVLGDQEINVIAISHGSSEISLSLVVEAKDAEATVNALHTLIFRPAQQGN